MNGQQAPSGRQDVVPGPGSHEHRHGLEPGSYTSKRLRNASAHHLHMTTRRYFIGPIPEGWLQQHRKSWYKAGLRFKNYSSKTVSFSADPVTVRYADNSADDPSGIEQETSQEQEHDETSGREEEETQGEDEETGNDPGDEDEDEEDAVQPLAESSSRRRTVSGKSVKSPSAETDGASSYVTAKSIPEAGEDMPDEEEEDEEEEEEEPALQPQPLPEPEPQLEPEGSTDEPSKQTLRVPSTGETDHSTRTASASETGSTTALLRSKPHSKAKGKLPEISQTNLERQEPQTDGTDVDEETPTGRALGRSYTSKLPKRIVKYSLDDNIKDKQRRLLARISRTQDTISANRPRRRRFQKGEILKAERMLVRVEETVQRDLPDDYTENDSIRMETRIVDKWREFLVVCRMTDDEYAPFMLQMYKTRVVPEIQKTGTKISPYYEVSLDNKKTRVNLYSSLDKSIVTWCPSKHGTKIYIMRPKSTAHAVEWYTFMCQALGRDRPASLQISVPDLGVSLIFKDPFKHLEDALNAKAASNGQGGSNARNLPTEESRVATFIIQNCMEMLEGRTEWSEVLKEWSKSEKMSLAWRRYDRLEWVLGVHEERMYGSMGMQDTHELELRPRHHYPTYIKHEGHRDEEPAPLEGFLVRLTSQRGVQQRMNKMFFKRLYFFTQNQYLFFCRPAKSLPPPPPRLNATTVSNIPSSQQILNNTPLSYEIDPFPVHDDDVAWTFSGSKEYLRRHDEEAYAQLHRNLHNTSNADGYIDLCRVKEVRKAQRDASPADPNINQGPDVEYNPEAQDSRRDDGATGEFDEDRTFEMVLDNGLVVRLQSYSMETRDEWITRAGALAKYWRARIAADIEELKAVRQRNLEILDIDEGVESQVGQFALKWEVKKAETSPLLHNMCSLSDCRTIKMSGQLYRKPRRHSTFKRCNVVLSGGKLLIFRSSLRQRNGVEIPHIHHELETSIDLSDCYIYSGLLTDADLLYSNQTFDSSNPGHHSLPRAYLSPDVFTTSDDDSAITFVIWHPLRKNYFRAREYGKRGKSKQVLKHVSTLGVHGRTVVFKARSRVEKDRWVMSIASEIDRIQEEEREDIRIVSTE